MIIDDPKGELETSDVSHESSGTSPSSMPSARRRRIGVLVSPGSAFELGHPPFVLQKQDSIIRVRL